MNKVAAITKLNEAELEQNISGTPASWHATYQSSDVIYIGGLPQSQTEQTLLSILEQYGVILHLNLARHPATNQSRGFAFVRYADPRSCVLAVDNFNAVRLDGRTLAVDHVTDYRATEDGVDTTPAFMREGLGDTHPQGASASAVPSGSVSGVDPAIADAEKRREAAVLKRLRVMQKKRRREDRDAVNCAVEATTDNTAAVTGSPHLSPSLGRQRNNNVLLRGNLRTEKELKKREKEKRRSERAKIREERARRREKRQHAQ